MATTSGSSDIFRRRVDEWLKAARYIDVHLDDFSRPETANYYQDVRHMFKPDAKHISDETLQVMQMELSEEASFHTDDFGTALRAFAGKISSIVKSRDQFHEALEELGEIRPRVPVIVHDRRIINGEMWDGQFLDDSPVKEGTIYYSNGLVYEGEWNVHGPHGRGTLSHSNRYGWELAAQFIDGKVGGNLFFKWLNGDSFTSAYIAQTSSFAHLLDHASGTYRFKSGEIEKGEFINGRWRTEREVPKARIRNKSFTRSQTVKTIISMTVAGLAACVAFMI